MESKLNNCYANKEDIFYWAKITSDDSFFYATDSEISPLFILPKSYFVKLTDESENLYKAQYNGIEGYLKKDCVTPMDGTPVQPYFTETFRAFLPSGTDLFAMTSSNNSYKIATIPYLFDGLVYYGSIEGEEAIPEKGNLWHYCKFGDDYGYVYSIFCDKLSSPPINNEIFPVLEVVNFNPPTAVSALSPVAMSFIIIGVSLPCLIVLYLLVKPSMMKNHTPKSTKAYKSKKRRDYFEFDPSDLS